MKKFFSLVLALVMALSLTTVAWGAASEVETADELLDAAKSGVAEIKLTDDIELPAGKHIPVVADLVVDGNDHSITFTPGTGLFNNLNGAAGPGPEGITNNLTVKNLTMISTTGGGHAVVAKNGTGDFAISFTNCHFEDLYCGVMLNGNVNPDPAANVAPSATVSASTFEDTEYGVSFVTEDCVDEVSFENNTMTGETSIQETFTNPAFLAAPTVKVSSGTFSSDVSDYVVPGMSLVNGTVVNNAGQHVGSTSALTSSKATCGATLADALANTTETVTVKAGLSASTELKSFATYQLEKKNVTTGLISNDGSQYIIVPTATNADMVVVDGTKIIYLAKVAGAVKYNDSAKGVKVAYDADPDCGDVYVDSTADAGTYYLYKNAYYVECAEASATIVFNVDGVAVYAKTTNLVKTLAHTYDYDVKTVAGKSEVTKVYCTACKANFSFVVGGVEDAVKAFGAGKYVNTGMTAPNGDDIFVYVAATVVGTPVVGGATVESAATFDAGIAMYVGMSVLAATGSAVVLKKREG